MAVCFIFLIILAYLFRKNFNIRISPKIDEKKFEQVENNLEEETVEEIVLAKSKRINRKKDSKDIPKIKKRGISKKIKTEE